MLRKGRGANLTARWAGQSLISWGHPTTRSWAVGGVGSHGQPQPRASGASLGTRMGQGWTRMSAHGTHGQADSRDAVQFWQG